MQTPVETRYARSGEVHIAYQTVGSGSVDLILLPGAFSHVEHQWEEPSFARFLRRLASFSRLIVLDVRGTGLSDRAAELPIRGEHALKGVPGEWQIFLVTSPDDIRRPFQGVAARRPAQDCAHPGDELLVDEGLPFEALFAVRATLFGPIVAA